MSEMKHERGKKKYFPERTHEWMEEWDGVHRYKTIDIDFIWGWKIALFNNRNAIRIHESYTAFNIQWVNIWIWL